MVSDIELETLTRDQLLDLAEVRGVEVPMKRPTRADLIKLLRDARKAK
jgi:hypothetical protein